MSETDIAVAAKLIAHDVTCVAVYLGERTRDDWKCYAWQVTFRRKHAELSIPFHMGMAHATKRWADEMKPTPPTAACVLHSLLLDSEAVHQSFDDWCGDLGMDSDSLKARKVYDECSDTGKRFFKMFDATLRAELSTLLEGY